jgi:hypothetical protein
VAQIAPEVEAAIRKALDQLRKKNIFEDVIGKEINKAGLTYDVYIQVMSDIRDIARKKKLSLSDAAEIYISKK